MQGLTLGCALIASALHLLFFAMESLWFMRPAVYRRLGAASRQEAEAMRQLAWNQGFYNLFLALGTIAGVVLVAGLGLPTVGYSLIAFGCGCMLAAAIVLLASALRLWPAALLQGLPPLLALAGMAAMAFQSMNS